MAKKKRLRHLQLICIGFFCLLGGLASQQLDKLVFSFDFSQFFPQGDPDLTFYEGFMEDFGTDDNFLLIAIPNTPTVFEREFLKTFDTVSKVAKSWPHVKEANSLTALSYPLKTSLGYSQIPIIHLEQPERYARDWEKIKTDGLFTKVLIDSGARSLVIALETEDHLDYKASGELLNALRSTMETHGIAEYHIMGRAFFYEAIVEMQRTEVTRTSIVAAILVVLILWLVYRNLAVVGITVISIGISLLLFMGLLAVLGKELNAMAAFYPVLMLIVGTSDAIHLTDSFVRKIRSGLAKESALLSSLKEVGMTTLLTSITTAIGFITLISSRLKSIQEFGINAALGVMVAYITVIFFTGALLLLLPTKGLPKQSQTNGKWARLLLRINTHTKQHSKKILLGTLIFIISCIAGISMISTNYEFKNSLPTNSQISEDFHFFQKNYAGFRPLEIALMAQEDHSLKSYDLAKEVEHLEGFLKSYPVIGNLQSPNTPVKILNKANNLNKAEALTLPKDSASYAIYLRDAQRYGRKQFRKLMTPDGRLGRINGKLQDVGTDSLETVYAQITEFGKTALDTSKLKLRVTGKSMLLDKNARYIRRSLLEGLGYGLFVIGIIMALVFRDFKLFLISLVPNVLPILFAGAVLGFLNIPLEAGLSVVFAIVFGIAVDDTIHFLAKYKLGLNQGLDREAALEKTFVQTGKALVVTTIILFFGFLVMLFSIHKPSVTIGIIISVTLVTALVLDLLLLPIFIRKFLGHKKR